MRISFGSTMPPDLTEGDLKEIGLLKWQLECPRMTIKSRATKSPDTYYGAGKVFYTPEGSLEFECFSHRERNTDEWPLGQSIPSGKVIPDSYFYDLKALDVNGNEWKSSRMIPRIHRTADGRSIVRGSVDQLTTAREMPSDIPFSGSSIRFWVFEDIEIPTNRRTQRKRSIPKTKLRSTSGSWNAWEFTVNKIRYLLINENGERLSFLIRSRDESFPDAFERRVVEAFQLVLGHPMNWMAMTIRQGQTTELRIRRQSLPKGKMHPPLPPGNIRVPGTNRLSPKYHRKLFHRFMKHTLKSKEYRHQIWGHLNAIAEASGSTFIDAKALTLTVTIENLLGSEFPSLAEPDSDLKNAIIEMRHYIEAWEGDPAIRERVLGAISNFICASATDKMRSLVDKGAITEDQYKSWKKLRHPTAHSYLSTGIGTQDMIQLLQACEVLFYHLVFYAIDYEGPYIDYAIPGWPLKKYPGGSLWSR
ncbi:MAG: hypothetical protein ACFFCO_11585 [Promethearchaeota archaeon]